MYSDTKVGDRIVDAIIVLANEMDERGNLNPESKARAIAAVEIFNSKKISQIVTCGWAYRRDSEINIADAFKAYMVNDLGVDPNKIISEVNSRDTVGDAFFTKTKIAIPFGWKNIIVVTSNYHLSRTREIFNFIYGPSFLLDFFCAEVEASSSLMKFEEISLLAFRKTFFGVNSGDDHEILATLQKFHLFYNVSIFNNIGK